MSNLEFTRGNILKLESELNVIPVNCKGVMGKGLALECKRLFPRGSNLYIKHCKTHAMRPGDYVRPKPNGLDESDKIFFLATKDEWRYPSKLEWIQLGLDRLVGYIATRHIRTVSVPALGCGKTTGQLNWNDIKPLLIQAAEKCPDVRWKFFEPTEV